MAVFRYNLPLMQTSQHLAKIAELLKEIDAIIGVAAQRNLAKKSKNINMLINNARYE